MDKLGVGIVGCGKVAEEYIKACLRDGRAEIRALANRSLEHPEMYRAKYNLECAVATSPAEVIARDDVQIVVVATPHDEHTRSVVAAAAAGKHVIVEKPVALNMAEVKEQQAAVAAAGVKSIVSFVLHWNPLLMTADRLIGEKAFGDVFMIEVDYLHRIWCGPERWLGTKAKGGSSMLAAGCHAADALRWFARSEAVEVCAYQVKTANPNEYPGTLMAVVKFANGAIGRVTSSFDAKMPYVFNIGVYGAEGSMRNDKVYAPKLFPGQNGFMTVPCILPDSADVAHHPFVGEMAHFLDCIIEERRPYPDLDDAAMTMALCIGADRSADEGRPVTMVEILEEA